LNAAEYDHMIKYAISIKNKTASNAAILRRETLAVPLRWCAGSLSCG
jgi:TnpA family transposase